MQNILKFLAVASTVSALAVPEAEPIEARASTQYNDNFDDLATSIATPQLYPVGVYGGLSYGGVVVLQPIEGAASVVPHSPKQHAGAAGPIDLLQLGQLTLNTYATIKRASGVKSFDLQDFYFGFGTDTGTTAGLAQPGILTVVAYDVNGKVLPVQTYSYSPPGTLNAPLTYAQLPSSFVNLQNVSFAVATSQPISERTYIALDNVRHVNH